MKLNTTKLFADREDLIGEDTEFELFVEFNNKRYKVALEEVNNDG